MRLDLRKTILSGPLDSTTGTKKDKEGNADRTLPGRGADRRNRAGSRPFRADVRRGQEWIVDGGQSAASRRHEVFRRRGLPRPHHRAIHQRSAEVLIGAFPPGQLWLSWTAFSAQLNPFRSPPKGNSRPSSNRLWLGKAGMRCSPRTGSVIGEIQTLAPPSESILNSGYPIRKVPGQFKTDAFSSYLVWQISPQPLEPFAWW